MWWRYLINDCTHGRAERAGRPERRQGSTQDSSLERWEFIAGPTGLTILPVGPILTQEDLAELSRRLEACEAGRTSMPVIFDLSRIEALGPHWTLVLATFLHLAERLSAECHVTGLKAQPAAVVNLYRGHRAVRQLVQASRSAA